MSLRASLARVDALIHATAPKSAPTHSFKVLDERKASGAIDGATGSLRQCSVTVESTPRDDGMAGAGGLRRVCECVLRVRYDSAGVGSRRDLDVMVGEDADALIDALRIGNAQTALTGLDGVAIDADDATREDITADGERVVGVLVHIPFTILYHEAV
jgi:hypothetical protein